MKILRTLLRRFGYALVPVNAVDHEDVRIAMWTARYSFAAESCGHKPTSEDIANKAVIFALDPYNAEDDRRAFAALLAAVEEHL
jgi:hypothetical protein